MSSAAPGSAHSSRLPTWYRSLLHPREPASAARALFAMTATLVSTVLVAQAVAPSGHVLDRPGLAVFGAVSSGCLVLAWMLRRRPERFTAAWSCAPLAGAALVCWLAVSVHEPGLRFDTYLILPAGYAARQLRFAGAALVMIVCGVADVVALAVVSGADALPAAIVFDSVLVVTALRLALSVRRADGRLGRAERLAGTDALTGLANRRAFDEHAALLVANSRMASRSAAVLLLDMDDFTRINDRFGHPGGDQALQDLSVIVHRLCRPADVAGRFGGDQIALLLDDITPRAALGRAEALREAVAQHTFVLPDGEEIRLTISVGLALAPEHGTELATLYANAETALQRAKRSGRDQVCAYTSGADATVLRFRPAG